MIAIPLTQEVRSLTPTTGLPTVAIAEVGFEVRPPN
jgi:hypothetical protein